MMFFTHFPFVSIARTPEENTPLDEHQKDKQSNAIEKRIHNDLNDDPNINEEIQEFEMHLNMYKTPKVIQLPIS